MKIVSNTNVPYTRHLENNGTLAKRLKKQDVKNITASMLGKTYKIAAKVTSKAWGRTVAILKSETVQQLVKGSMLVAGSCVGLYQLEKNAYLPASFCYNLFWIATPIITVMSGASLLWGKN